jgi:2-polyprenyl-3-methyl-5-hydroxy-6-metoxy-1,4-benzoquinol methylase
VSKADFNPSYVGQRPDIEKLIPPEAKLILDVGCSTGTLGAAVKAKTGAQVIGIELSEQMANEASHRIDKVFTGDATEVIRGGDLSGYLFDAIIFADALEHFIDPWITLSAAATHLSPRGVIIASIPNIRHIDTIYNLAARGYWPYRDRGIHDRTHLRFFTKKSIEDLFEQAGLSIDVIATNYRLLEAPHKINRFARFLALPGLRPFLAFQYLIRARPAKRSI